MFLFTTPFLPFKGSDTSNLVLYSGSGIREIKDDITNDNLIENYTKVREELSKYSSKLTKKKEIIVLNKIDMIDEQTINKKIKLFKNRVKKRIFTISALKQKGIKTIKKSLLNYVY